MYRLDQQTESLPQANTARLLQKARRSLRLSIIAGLLAMTLFTLTSLLLLACFLARIDPFTHRLPGILILLAVSAVPLLAIVSWLLSLRYFTLSRMAAEKKRLASILPPPGPMPPPEKWRVP